MAIQIKLKNSVVQDSTPSTSDLPVVGELALNANINSIGGFMRASDNTIVKIFGPGSVTTPTATTTVSGISELATNSETTTGTATNRVVTPAGLNAVTAAERTTSNSTYLALAGGTLTGVVAATAGSNSAPSIHFGDSDSGIFGGTNTVSLAAGGTTRLTADTGVSVVGTLTVTGAITSTDDLTIPDKIIHSGDTNTAIRFPAADTVSVETGGSEALRVDSGQRVLIGTSTNLQSQTQKVQIAGTDANSAIILSRFSANNLASYLHFQKSRNATVGGNTIVQDDDLLGRIYFQGNDGSESQSAAYIEAFVDGTPGATDMPGRLVFSTTADGAASPTERLTIDSSGNVGIGETSPANLLHVKVSDAGIAPHGSAQIVLERAGTNYLQFLTANDGTSGLLFGDADDIDVTQIKYDHNTKKLSFVTETDTALTIDENQKVGIGTTSPAANLHVHTDSNGEGVLIKSTGDTSNALTFDANRGAEGVIAAMYGRWNGTTVAQMSFVSGSDTTDKNDGFITFGTESAASDGNVNATEQMRIDSSGNVYFGVTSTPNGSSVGGSAFIVEDNNREVLYLATTGGTETLARFHNSNGQVGVITVSGSSTSYVESSDYRLKENETAISDGITRIKTLKPYRFNFKSEPDKTVDGFFAHEVSPVVPQAITGEKDAVKKDGSIDPQGIDHSKLVPLLVAAVQELIGKVEALEAA